MLVTDSFIPIYRDGDTSGWWDRGGPLLKFPDKIELFRSVQSKTEQILI